MKRLNYFLLALILTFSVSCSEVTNSKTDSGDDTEVVSDDEETEVEAAPVKSEFAEEQEALLIGQWQLDQFVVMEGDEMTEEEEEFWGEASDAMRDHSFWTMNEDGTYSMEIGSPDGIEEEESTWRISEDGTKIISDEGTAAEDHIDIMELDEARMKVDMSEVGDSEKTHLTFVK